MSVEYDLVVIGSGPAGQKAAIQAAKLGKRVAMLERGRMVGGVCVNTGTIPSKTLREAVLYLTGLSHRFAYGQSYRLKDELTIDDLLSRAHDVIDAENDVIRDQLRRNRVELIQGTGRFVEPHVVAVDTPDDVERRVEAPVVVIAVGTSPTHPAGVEFAGGTVLDSDGILNLGQIPASLVVVGAGVIGIEYASMFAAVGTKVTVVERHGRLLEFCDAQIVEGLQYHLRELGVTFRFNEDVVGVTRHDSGAVTELASGKRVPSEAVLYSAGRRGAVDALDLEKIGLEADERGRIAVDERYRTAAPGVYAVGDVIGFPSLAATSAEQGRLAACDAFDHDARSIGTILPVGIYTIPEISYVGATEEELTSDAIPYEVGISRYRELARGQIIGDRHGLLKLLVGVPDRRVLGVHVFGTGATEVVHIGQAVMINEGTVDALVDTVFNYPTLAESYKVAALDVTNKLHALSRLSV
ncbi:MAG: Si-specific NAD(P)(+) transhydrogenase [Gaiellaceae bacterium]